MTSLTTDLGKFKSVAWEYRTCPGAAFLHAGDESGDIHEANHGHQT